MMLKFKRLILGMMLILFFMACNRYAPKKPDNLISKSDMINILIDSKLISSASSANKKIMKNHGLDNDTYLFEKYGIDSLQFALSNEYYAYKIKDYEEIYTAVTDSLKKLELQFTEVKKEEDKQDSLLLEAAKKKDSTTVSSVSNKE